MSLATKILVISAVLVILGNYRLLTYIFYEVVVLALIEDLTSASTWLSHLFVHW